MCSLVNLIISFIRGEGGGGQQGNCIYCKAADSAMLDEQLTAVAVQKQPSELLQYITSPTLVLNAALIRPGDQI